MKDGWREREARMFVCAVCGEEFLALLSAEKYCGEDCRAKKYAG